MHTNVTSLLITSDGDILEVCSPGRSKIELNQYIRKKFNNKIQIKLINERIYTNDMDLEIWYNQYSTHPINQESLPLLGKQVRGPFFISTRNPTPSKIDILKKGDFIDTDKVKIQEIIYHYNDNQKERNGESLKKRKKLVIKINRNNKKPKIIDYHLTTKK